MKVGARGGLVVSTALALALLAAASNAVARQGEKQATIARQGEKQTPLARQGEKQATVAQPVKARDTQGAPDREYSPAVRSAGTTNLYWGDTHLHTRNSADAYTVGTHMISPDDAFRFAQGAELVSDNGVRARLRRPLDFLAVTDHAEYLGVFARLQRNDPALSKWPLGQEWAGYMRRGESVKLGSTFANAIQSSDPKYRLPRNIEATIWADVARTADRFYQPGRFTTFIGYEWTSMINGDNLHRVVLFKDGAETAAKVLPFSAQDSTDPEALWQALENYEKQTGGEVLAIAHNGNVSNGRMFAPTTVSGQPLTAAYARTRSRWEPVYEVTQMKGDGEAHPTLSPTDEFADFETWDEGNITLTAAKQPWMLQYEYARSGLKEGLRHEEKLGVNPFKFGMIGSTDSHTGLATTEEDNFFGKFPESSPQPDRTTNKMAGQLQQSWQLGSQGLAAVWAPENTREAIFAAFKRREVYATTGTRIKVRFFGGWDFKPDDVYRPDYDRIGYSKGVPMGGELMSAPAGKAPVFMVVAARDPENANLDRIQIIKGWLDAKGETHEKIYDVALSDGRKVDPRTGKAPAVGSTVDVKNATYANTIGDAELTAVWRDPDFDPRQRAFYYVRVLEIPKPRWTAYDAKFFKLNLPDEIPMTVQDRAYTSPIWYRP